jgi:hypothetical protein
VFKSHDEEIEMSVLQALVDYDGSLYAAWKGQPDDDRVFYSRWNGRDKWAPALPMASGTVGANTSAGPSFGVLNGSLYAAWKGEWSDPRLFFAKFNGSNWETQKQIPNVYSAIGPALCSFGGKLIAAWKNVFDQNLYFATYDGSNWSAKLQIVGVGSSVGPSLANFGGKLYAVWKGESSDQGLYYASYDGTKWAGQTPGSSQTQIPGVGSSVGASLAGVDDKLYAVWKGEGTDERLYYAYYDGRKWSGQTPGSTQTQIPDVTSSVGAAIAEFGGKLYGVCKGKDSDASLYNAEFSGSTWSGWHNDIPGNTGPDSVTLQTARTGGRLNYTIADVKGAPLTGATVVLTVVQDIIPANSGAYSTQVNCNSPAQTGSASPFVWQQYGFRIARNTLFAWVNCFRAEDGGTRPFINWDSRFVTNGVVSLPSNTLPAGWQLTTTLATDQNNHVTGFSCVATNAAGVAVVNVAETLLGISSPATSANLAPILNYQAVLVAENKSDDGKTDSVKFNSGQAIFLLTANNEVVANIPQGETLEQSNISYSALPNSYPNGEFYQLFGVGTI